MLDLTALGDSLHRRALEQQVRLETEDWARDERVNKEIARRWAGAAALILPLVARKADPGPPRADLGARRTTGPRTRWTWPRRSPRRPRSPSRTRGSTRRRARAYRELKEAQARIIQSEKMAVVGTFASGLAHEVRNPLNSIALQLSILERRVGAARRRASPARSRTSSGVIREEVKRLDNLVGDFLQFSRSEPRAVPPGQPRRPRRRGGPPAAPRGAGRRRHAAAPAHRRADLPDLRLDAEKMKQVVINLVRNAIEAMPERRRGHRGERPRGRAGA